MHFLIFCVLHEFAHKPLRTNVLILILHHDTYYVNRYIIAFLDWIFNSIV